MSRLTGQVKFFNKSKGYGFIKDLDSDTETFVHFTALETADQLIQKCLFKGEYVEYEIIETGDKPKAAGVTGIRKNKLMCEFHVHEKKPETNQEEQ